MTQIHISDFHLFGVRAIQKISDELLHSDERHFSSEQLHSDERLFSYERFFSDERLHSVTFSSLYLLPRVTIFKLQLEMF